MGRAASGRPPHRYRPLFGVDREIRVNESEDNVVVDVAAGLKRPAADGRGSEILHDDGSITRVSPDAVGQAGNGRFRLDRGSVWHEPPVSAPGQRFTVELDRATVTTDTGVL